MIKEELIKQENLQVGDIEIEAALKDIAEKANVDVKEIQKYYQNKKNREDLVHQLEEKRIYDRLLKTAKIKEVKVPQEKSNLIQTA